VGDGNEQITYTKDYFLNSTGPYEKLYAIKSSFERNRELEKMADIAKSCKVLNFKALFKSYCESVAMSTERVYAENVTNFTGQELELDTGQWKANDFGITRFNAKGYEDVACVHAIMPVERLVNIDTGLEKTRIAFAKGGDWRSIVCNRSQLASARSIIELADYGVAVTSESAKHLVQYICDVENLNYSIIPEHNSVSRLGWIGRNEFSPYVENLIFDGDINFRSAYRAVTEKAGTAQEWIDFVKKIRARNNMPSKIALAASFASVLVEPCNCSLFFVHFWGGSGNGKTVALMLAASVWANPKVGEYIHTFNSTDVGQELYAGFVNSLPLILDEFQIQRNDKKSFDSTIYKLTEGAGRTRGSKTGGLQRVQTWRNCILSSGESPITSAHSGGGAINRIIEINTENTKFFQSAKQTADFLIHHYGHAGEMFIEELMKPEIREMAIKAQGEFFEQLSNKDITEKQTMAASLILTADALIDLLIFKDGNGLTADEMAKFLATHSDVSSDIRAYEWLIDWITQNSIKFSEDNAQETWGKKDHDKICIIRNIFNRACAENNYNATSFLSWLKREGLIETEGRGYTKRVRMNGIKCQCVVLKLDLIPEGFEEIPENEQEVF
jgi:hypothetical protein